MSGKYLQLYDRNLYLVQVLPGSPLRTKEGTFTTTFQSLFAFLVVLPQYLKPPLMVESGEVDFSRSLTYPSIRSIPT